jgi:DNA-binding NtrC family response regulator
LGDGWNIEPEAVAALERYRWPGNVRQLINVIERAKILADDRMVLLDDLPQEIEAAAEASPGGGPADATAPLSDELSALQKAHVLEILKRERGNKAKAARALGVNRRSLYRMLERYGIHTAEHA